MTLDVMKTAQLIIQQHTNHDAQCGQHRSLEIISSKVKILWHKTLKERGDLQGIHAIWCCTFLTHLDLKMFFIMSITLFSKVFNMSNKDLHILDTSKTEILQSLIFCTFNGCRAIMFLYLTSFIGITMSYIQKYKQTNIRPFSPSCYLYGFKGNV